MECVPGCPRTAELPRELPENFAAKETRLTGGDPLSRATSWAAYRGLNSHHAPAVLTGDHQLANSAGVSVAVRRRIAIKRLTDKQFGTGPVCLGRVAVTRAQAVVPGGFLWISLYGYTGIGCAGLNVQLLEDLGRFPGLLEAT